MDADVDTAAADEYEDDKDVFGAATNRIEPAVDIDRANDASSSRLRDVKTR